MIKLDENKLAKLRTSSEHLTEKYGELGSPEREEFEARAKAYYYAELLKEQRKQQKMTQQQLADKIRSESISQILSVETVICNFLLLCKLRML